MLNKLLHYLYFFIYHLFFSKRKKKAIDYVNDKLIFNSKTETEKVPKIIWMFWFDEEIPELVNKCIVNTKRLHQDYEIHILNKNTVTNFIELDLNKLIQKMPMANLSDLIRLKLLSKYGGVWLDASIILTERIDNFFLDHDQTFDLVAFYNKNRTQNSELLVIESWMLAAPVNSLFINTWLKYFAPVEELGSLQLFENYKKLPNFNDLIKGLDNPSYLIVYIAAKLAFMDVKESGSLLFHSCDESAFAVQLYSGWRTRRCTVNFYMNNKFINSPIFKLANGDRKYYDFLKQYKLINPKSIVGLFLESMNND